VTVDRLVISNLPGNPSATQFAQRHCRMGFLAARRL
jgi:hypothetical protein